MRNVIAPMVLLAVTLAAIAVASGQSVDNPSPTLDPAPALSPPSPEATPGPSQPSAPTIAPAPSPPPAKPAISPSTMFKAECGACHIPFPPAMLPARSWTALMNGLAVHFGENAGLDADTVQTLRTYLEANAADAGGRGRRILRGLKPDMTPLRITQMPFWIAIHGGEVSTSAFKRAKSKSNCAACHTQAANGVFGDD